MRYVLILCALPILALPPLSLADPADTTADEQPANSRVDPNSRERTIAACVRISTRGSLQPVQCIYAPRVCSIFVWFAAGAIQIREMHV